MHPGFEQCLARKSPHQGVRHFLLGRDSLGASLRVRARSEGGRVRSSLASGRCQRFTRRVHASAPRARPSCQHAQFRVRVDLQPARARPPPVARPTDDLEAAGALPSPAILDAISWRGPRGLFFPGTPAWKPAGENFDALATSLIVDLRREWPPAVYTIEFATEDGALQILLGRAIPEVLGRVFHGSTPRRKTGSSYIIPIVCVHTTMFPTLRRVSHWAHLMVSTDPAPDKARGRSCAKKLTRLLEWAAFALQEGAARQGGEGRKGSRESPLPQAS